MKAGKNMLMIFLWLGFIGFNVKAQKDIPDYPEAGKPCPDFTLQNIRYYPKGKASLKDFRGKWLLLDFWGKSCASCIASFPHINEIQKDLGDRVQVMLVGILDREKTIETIYSRYRAKENLTMPCAFDSAIAQRFDIAIVPRYILIDDKGVVQCYTNVMHKEEMKAFLSGEHPSMPKAYRMHEDVPEDESQVIAYDIKYPFMLEGNGAPDSNYLYRSVLAEWKSNYAARIVNIKQGLREHPGRYELLGCPLTDLYLNAFFGESFYMGPDYYGKYSDKLILEIKDSSLFKYSDKYGSPKNLFCYTIAVPSATSSEERIRNIMQRDLQNYFGYEVNVETRKVPCWAITASATARGKIKAKGRHSFKGANIKTGFSAEGLAFKELLNYIRYSNQSEVILDESGITGEIDIDMNCEACVLTDILDVKKELQANGLDLLRVERDMKVLVVRDPLKRIVHR
jgi:thiol-disulfide isomerase/thioredoxin